VVSVVSFLLTAFMVAIGVMTWRSMFTVLFVIMILLFWFKEDTIIDFFQPYFIKKRIAKYRAMKADTQVSQYPNWVTRFFPLFCLDQDDDVFKLKNSDKIGVCTTIVLEKFNILPNAAQTIALFLSKNRFLKKVILKDLCARYGHTSTTATNSIEILLNSLPPQLTYLDMCNICVTYEEYLALGSFLQRANNLSHLSLCNIGLNSDSLVPLIRLSHLFPRNLKVLKLNSNNIGTVGCAELPRILCNFSNLKELHLSGCSIIETRGGVTSGIMTISNAIRRTQLEVIDISDNYISYDDAVSLANSFLFLPTLKVLSVDDCRLCPAGLSVLLESLVQNPNFAILNSQDFSKLENYDSCFNQIIRLVNCPNLKQLVLCETSMSVGIKNRLNQLDKSKKN